MFQINNSSLFKKEIFFIQNNFRNKSIPIKTISTNDKNIYTPFPLEYWENWLRLSEHLFSIEISLWKLIILIDPLFQLETIQIFRLANVQKKPQDMTEFSSFFAGIKFIEII